MQDLLVMDEISLVKQERRGVRQERLSGLAHPVHAEKTEKATLPVRTRPCKLALVAIVHPDTNPCADMARISVLRSISFFPIHTLFIKEERFIDNSQS